MLEIFLLLTLIRSVKNNVTSRGRKPGGFIALAVILWVIPELIGLGIGISLDMGYGSYLIAAALVGIGVVISYNVAKHCKEGDYVTPQEQLVRQFTEYYEPLPAEQEVLITREKAFSGSAAKYDMVLNGHIIGTIGNGETLHARTNQRQNILVARLNGGDDLPPFIFQVADGFPADVHFVAGRFLPDHSAGIVAYGQAVTVNPAIAVPRYVPVINTPSTAPVYANPVQPVYSNMAGQGYANPEISQAPVAQSPFAAREIAMNGAGATEVETPKFCENCGSPLAPGCKFCGKCGAAVIQ